MGSELVELAKEVASGSKFVTFKTDEKTWGVTGVNDERLTLHSFGEYKNHTRLEAEAKLSAYFGCVISANRATPVAATLMRLPLPLQHRVQVKPVYWMTRCAV